MARRVALCAALCAAHGAVAVETVTGCTAEVRIEEGGTTLAVASAAFRGTLHAEWLRERCQSNASVDALTRQPRRPPHEFDAPTAASATVRCGDAPGSDAELLVAFADGHRSTFPLHRIAREVSDAGELLQVEEWELPTPLQWNTNLTELPTFGFHDVMSDDEARHQALGALLATGIVRLRGAPQREGECVAAADSLSTLRATEWGRSFNVRTVPDQGQPGGELKRDLAYTPHQIGMHTDNPYRDPTPDYQLLHAIDHCTCPEGVAPCERCGVMNGFVDGLHVAQILADTDPEAFALLASIPVRFENNGGDNTSALWHRIPHFELHHGHASTKCTDAAACVRSIRFSPKSGGYTPATDLHVLQRFYAARRKFSQMVHDPRYMMTAQLAPGDMFLFDNHRVLHSRSAIQPTDGARFLQGCYLNRDGLRLQYERLRRRWPKWRSLREASAADVHLMGEEYARGVTAGLAGRLLGMLDAQRGAHLGQPVDLRTHGLQTATRALRNGEDDDVVVASLLHDVTETIQAKGHGEAAAALLAPYLSPAAQWTLRHHEVFQGFYYYHHFGGDRRRRDALRGSPHFDATARWCELYDQASFDPGYPTLPPHAFDPALRRVLGREPYWWDAEHLNRLAVTG